MASELNVGEFFNVLRESCQEERGYRTYIIEAVDKSDAAFGIDQDRQIKQVVEYLANKETRVL